MTRTRFGLAYHLMCFLAPEWPNPWKKICLETGPETVSWRNHTFCLPGATRSIAVLCILKKLIPEASQSQRVFCGTHYLFLCIINHAVRISADVPSKKGEISPLSLATRVFAQLLCVNWFCTQKLTNQVSTLLFQASSVCAWPDPRIRSSYGHAISSKKVVTLNLKVK